jgi:hypothetical protein
MGYQGFRGYGFREGVNNDLVNGLWVMGYYEKKYGLREGRL